MQRAPTLLASCKWHYVAAIMRPSQRHQHDTMAGLFSSSSPANPQAGLATAHGALNPQSAFAAIRRWDQFHDQLNQRVTDPSKIAQKDASLCGPAAFMYCVAKHRPQVYRQYVIDLAEKGEARLGNLVVKPSNSCRQAGGGEVLAKGMDPVDWVALASLRDSSNSLLSMTPDASAAGITMPHDMEHWFDACGLFHGTGNHTRLATGGTTDDLFAANSSFSTGAFVCLFVRAAIIGGGGAIGTKIGNSGRPKTLLFTPDHWVVLHSSITIDRRFAMRNMCPPAPGTCALDDRKLEFSFYTWGGIYKVNGTRSTLTVGDFLPYFYGYVSAGTPR